MHLFPYNPEPERLIWRATQGQSIQNKRAANNSPAEVEDAMQQNNNPSQVNNLPHVDNQPQVDNPLPALRDYAMPPIGIQSAI